MKSLRAFGYLAIFIPPALLVLGRWTNLDWLLPLSFFVALPLLRVVAGSVSVGAKQDWTEAEKGILAWIPRLYVGALLASMGAVLFAVGSMRPLTSLGDVGFVLSVLVMCGLASCVAHELGHRPLRSDRRNANLICAVAGYPFFVFEHLAHHAQARDTNSAHCPSRNENVWMFVARRAWSAPQQAIALNSRSRAGRREDSLLDDLWSYVGLTAAVWIMFTVVGGLFGFLLYLTLIVGVPFLLNTITYIQHWGLGDDSHAVASDITQIGWDETARIQSWLILGISFHHQHHNEATRPYYTYGPTEGAPTLPAEYALLFPVCLIPPLWRLMMNRTIRTWVANRNTDRSMASPSAT